MRCGECGTENPPTALTCRRCSTALGAEWAGSPRYAEVYRNTLLESGLLGVFGADSCLQAAIGLLIGLPILALAVVSLVAFGVDGMLPALTAGGIGGLVS